MSGWIAVDLDGTLAVYDGWVSIDHIGAPVPEMLERVKRWIGEGRDVKLFTARLSETGDVGRMLFRKAWRAWCVENDLPELQCTCIKDFGMEELWDDRAVQVEANTGRMIGYSRRGLA